MAYNLSLTDSFYCLHRYIYLFLYIKMCPNIQRFSNQKKTHDIPILIIDIFLYCVKYNFLQYNISPIKSRPSKKK